MTPNRRVNRIGEPARPINRPGGRGGFRKLRVKISMNEGMKQENELSSGVAGRIANRVV